VPLGAVPRVSLQVVGSHKEHPMLRPFACAGFALVLCAAVVLAAEYRGKVKSVDPDKNSITITDKDGKDQTLKVAKDDLKVMVGKKEMPDGLRAKAFSQKRIDKGINVILVTEGEGAKERVKEIRVKGGKKKKE
jgi:hypothetical protein